jgi:hypothetical protein
MVINIVFSFVIIIRSARREGTFKAWLGKNQAIAAITTVLAGADMEMLKLLTSNLSGTGLETFNAPPNKEFEKLILWGCLVGSFIEDLPQFIIQVCIHNSIFFIKRSSLKKQTRDI